MAVLQIRVVLGGASPLADTVPNQRRIIVFGNTRIYGTQDKMLPPRGSPYAYRLNNPSLSGAVSVTAAQAVTFDSIVFQDNPSLAEQMAEGIEEGFIIIEDTANAGVPLVRANLTAYVSP